MTTVMDLSFPGQRTATATSCIPHDSVYMPEPRAGKSENGFFRCDTWLQIFQNDPKICEAEVTLTPLINKICKPWHCWIVFLVDPLQKPQVDPLCLDKTWVIELWWGFNCKHFFLLCKLAALKLLSVMSHYYTLYSLSVFSLAKSLRLILEISATYRLVSYLLADNWLIYNTIQYNSLLTLLWWGFSVTMRLLI